PRSRSHRSRAVASGVAGPERSAGRSDPDSPTRAGRVSGNTRRRRGGAADRRCRPASGNAAGRTAHLRVGGPAAASRRGRRGGRAGKAGGPLLVDGAATVVCAAGTG